MHAVLALQQFAVEFGAAEQRVLATTEQRLPLLEQQLVVEADWTPEK
jgi:hypothetical protein